jgi:beta-glucuronidase
MSKMKRITLSVALLINIGLFAQQSIINVYNRQIFSLNGKWNYMVDPYENGYYDYRYSAYDESPNPTGGFFLDRQPTDKTDLVEYSFYRSPTLMVPKDWNTQDEKLFYYEGTIWYRRTFNYVKSNPTNRLFVNFGAANYESDVYLNKKKLGKHIGGFTPFQYEITQSVKDSLNSLIVRVDNKRKREAVPTLNTDWWNYGGLTRDVMVVEVPETFISDYFIQLKKGNLNQVQGYVKLNGTRKKQKIHIEIPELKSNFEFDTNEEGIATIDFPLKKLELWTPEKPKLYQVVIASETDKTTEKIGFRSIEAKGTEILLNGSSMFLRGICMHEENPIRGGRAYSAEDARMLLNWAKELNCNYVRLAHYPHNEYMARLADEMGILLWEEIPVYWTILWENQPTFDNAKNQLTELIDRDKNRASVIIWSMANETPVGDARTSFLKKLAETARNMDNTRLISAAMEVHTDPNNPKTKIVEDTLADIVDVVSFNQYIGWYDGLPEKCKDINWVIKYNKPILVSEFGADALQGYHADRLTRFSEEYQEDLYKKTLDMLVKIPQLRGLTPWILCDFRSPRRLLPNVQDGWNRKGLIGENGVKKKAFYVLKDFYDRMEAKK